MLIAPYSALSSSEGYEYQWYIATYIALKKLLEICLDENKINNYKIEFESAEDFSIIYNGKYESLHQVKSGGIDLKEVDKFSFIISVFQYQVSKGFYHIKPRKSIPLNFIQATKAKVEEYIQTIKKVSLLKDSKEIYKEIGFYDEKGHQKKKMLKGTLADIFDYIAKSKQYNRKNMHEFCYSEIIEILNEIGTELELYLGELGNISNDNEKVLVYDDSFENIIQIQERCIGLIEQIVGKCDSGMRSVVQNKEYCETIFKYIYFMIKTKISREYVEPLNLNKSATVDFQDILNEILKDHNQVTNSSEYLYVKLRKKIHTVFLKYQDESCLVKCENCENSDNCNIYINMKHLDTLDCYKIEDLLFKILLFVPTYENDNNMPSDDIIEMQLIEILKDFNKMRVDDKNIFQGILCNEDYRLTLDSSKKIDSLKRKIEQMSMQSEDNYSLMFESSNLIVENFDGEKILSQNIKSTNLGKEELEEIESKYFEEYEKSVVKPKIINLVSLNKIKELL